MSTGKHILLCVTGGIAVFKAAALTSKIRQAGYDVKVMMTKSAMEFVTPLTFQTLSRNPVYHDTFDEKDPSGVAHIDLADWADLVVIAPATANSIGKLANGIADDMVSTTLLATSAPVMLAPAMNVHMYGHPAVFENMERLADFGHRFIEPGEGLLACGYVGKGRLAEPEEILASINQFFTEAANRILQDKHVLITAGPTREHIDPVRYFSNRSTGKMGYALAEAAVSLGAKVTLVSGPSVLKVPYGVEFLPVETAKEMYEAVISRFELADLVIKSAAVADYRPKLTYDSKMKKSEGSIAIEMERTTDILKELGRHKKHQVLVGFAAETDDVSYYAKDKLEQKNLDMIVANDVSQKGSGFEGDTNQVHIYGKDGHERKSSLLSKKQVAEIVLKDALRYMEGLNEG
ncbi:bifunctional phosphopantothenoylcysteine decarboxylase/phosphopantothenate--cysteine ligase CoaBC [Pseudalkalibacillus salsuginis]|uniref:bifunctional phosphopantothenoylcysteine decarboxylase/phosphopantothenate--cysteine ligase CoaBC n=1 Tax=Pseudalkalibacillus salsuginis TaxID=2910972 RepID=UPI001F447254|nr:bifunctional phosphopantothenoylcysteine decarboxylase/phosphopantothenate--cysteine ligase CoaBC [Pseudalkalibacillus salsuginis]MCF6410512.1 bifunctional phosphopantothenoylcysteine decarboxylase/phosphopantothenate--cysteine ligase CoaBC [Pseudalkalibacillus salsuginis]